jgi:hypothetical protein
VGTPAELVNAGSFSGQCSLEPWRDGTVVLE